MNNKDKFIEEYKTTQSLVYKEPIRSRICRAFTFRNILSSLFALIGILSIGAYAVIFFIYTQVQSTYDNVIKVFNTIGLPQEYRNQIMSGNQSINDQLRIADLFVKHGYLFVVVFIVALAISVIIKWVIPDFKKQGDK